MQRDIWIRCIGWACFLISWIPFAGMFYVLLTGGTWRVICGALGIFIILVVLFTLLLAGSFLAGRRDTEKIRQTGIPATATVLRIRDTGTRLNGQQLAKIELVVHPPSGTPFTAAVEYLVPYYELPELQPGAPVPVWYTEGGTDVALAGF